PISGRPRRMAQGGRRLRGLLLALVGYAVPLALLAVAMWVVLWLARLDWTVLQEQLVAGRRLPIVGWTLTPPVLAVLAVLIGAVIAYLCGFLLQVLRAEATPHTRVSDESDKGTQATEKTGRTRDATHIEETDQARPAREVGLTEEREMPPTWQYARLTHAAGTSAGWAVLYGAGYLGVAAFVSARPDWLSQQWAQVLVLTTALLGLVLVLVLPWALPLWALISSHNAEMRRQTRSGKPWPPPTPPEADPAEHAKNTLATELVSRGVAYRARVRPPADPIGSPRLRPLGAYLNWRMARSRRGQQPGPPP
ncbi:MAG: hypothetical protein WBG36_12195, partial [Ornithinimicrobium sp.]